MSFACEADVGAALGSPRTEQAPPYGRLGAALLRTRLPRILPERTKVGRYPEVPGGRKASVYVKFAIHGKLGGVRQRLINGWMFMRRSISGNKDDRRGRKW